MNAKLADDQMLPERLAIAEAMWANNRAAYLEARANTMLLIDALKRARSAIITAIHHEDGLDGNEGEVVLEYIRQVLSVNGVEESTWGDALALGKEEPEPQ